MRWGIGAFLSLVIVLAHAGAHADDLPLAKRYFEAGVEAYDGGRFEIALREFQHSHALSHNPALYFNMAACEEKLDHFQAAALLLRQYVIEQPDAGDVSEVEARIHVLEQRDETLKRKLSEPAPAPPAPVVVAPPRPAPPPPPPKRVASFALLGVTGALGVAAAGTGGFTVTEHDRLKAGCGATPAGCTADQEGAMKSAALATDVLLGLTVAAAVTTVVLFIVEPRLGRRGRQAALGPAGVRF